MLKKSMKVINKNFIFVILMGLLYSISAFLNTSTLKPFLLMGIFAILSFVVDCGIFASLWQYSKEEKYNFLKGIKENFWHYLGAKILSGLIIGIIGVITLMLFKGSLPLTEFMQSTKIQPLLFVQTIVFTILFVFVNPYVFTKGEGLDAVLDGIKYISKNYRNSKLAISIAFYLGATTYLVGLLDRINLLLTPKIILLVLTSITLTYIMLLAFLVASFTLTKSESAPK